MDLSSLGCLVKPSETNRFCYRICMRHKNEKWELLKSFADFERLQEILVDLEYCDIPLLPDVNFSAGLDALAEIHNAHECLTEFLIAEYLGGTESYNLAVSDVIVLEKEKLLIVSYEEKTVLSKIGRMWSIIEPEVIGSVRIFSYGMCMQTLNKILEEDPYSGYNVLHESSFIFKIRCMAFDAKRRMLFLANGNGQVERYTLELEPVDLKFVDSLTLHSEAIMSIDIRGDYYYTSSYDDSIRKVDISSNKPVGGGKLTRRLNGDKLMTATVLGDDLMLLGTCDNKLFTYSMAGELPNFVDCFNAPLPNTIRRIISTSKNVFVAHGNCVSCFPFTKTSIKKPVEQGDVIELNGLSSGSSNAFTLSVSTPLKIRSAQFSIADTCSFFYANEVYDVIICTENKRLYASYNVSTFLDVCRLQESVAIWCLVTGKMLYSWIAHRNEVCFSLFIKDDLASLQFKIVQA
ncbi:bifunctional WD40-YVTN repeat-like-containing domain superfamily/WD40-repeat-containing domain superfamily/PX domain superfamily [Babesia duncani]|uniref:Bifunctional WD40-YVTN repeat-like-containing domain superfamily/WD40-repeat-containing domain superfamily/PX domain superfamily n=1 Tax=Babesia duncani TaxID=323732 RepID=A0AAD9PIJ3_9APIC|nr:bifunctional WD40-YVTN repeat-like-containing domain superfamily/WD40-repeat-containing domain superfamily/PX domain superfamily [Babesia duncani]